MTVNARRFYIYAYLREDGTPYYVGRGQRHRMHNVQQHVVGVPPRERRVKLVTELTDDEANEWEVDLIQLLGRIDLGTGCLRNLTDGGNDGNTGWVPTEEYKEEKARQMREWHRLNPNANNAKIAAAKKGHEVAAETRQKIAVALIDEAEAAKAGLTVKQWAALDQNARQRVRRQLAIGMDPAPDATVRELKACQKHGLTVAQWRALTKTQRKHIARTMVRATTAAIPYFTWIQLEKSEQVRLARAAA